VSQPDAARVSSVGFNHQPLRQAVQDAIRHDIVVGRFQPGERLLEENLALELDVSRNPVREALQALSVEGFVELEPRRGARVATISPGRARELFEVREALEALVAKLAAERCHASQLAALEDVVAEGRAAVTRGDSDVLVGLNTRFHRALAETAANRLLADELSRLAHVVEWVYGTRILARAVESWREHAAIVEAIASHDPTRAMAAAAHHIAQARAAFLGDDDTGSDPGAT
jgi:DNA-binding GntR family transcriptional regulator